MNILEIIAAQRTGQHAIISWIVRNLTDMVLKLGDEGGAFKLEYVNKKLVFWNDVNHEKEFGLKLFRDLKWGNGLENLIVNYEDAKHDYSFFCKNEIYKGPLSYFGHDDIDIKNGQRLLLIRDIYNCMSSRYNSKTKPRIDQVFIDTWKDNAKFAIKNPKMTLKYEDWMSNDEKRQQILFDYFKIDERIPPSKVSGRASSFDNKNYNNRYDNNIPEEIKDLIRKDTELHYLLGVLGYEFKII